MADEEKWFKGEAAHGVVIGKLKEDMIDTVRKTKGMWCDVDIPDFFVEDGIHPLTYVPLWAMSLPLRKDDLVMVRFFQDDLTMPVLWKNYSELDADFINDFEIPEFFSDNGMVKKPDTQKTVSAQRIGKDSYIVETDKYTIIHRGNGFVMLEYDSSSESSKQNVYVYGDSINVIGKESVNINCDSAKIIAKKSMDVDCSEFTINKHLKVTK